MRAISQAQQSFTSLIIHMNRSNTALAGQKCVLTTAKENEMQENPGISVQSLNLNFLYLPYIVYCINILAYLNISVCY